MLLLRKARPGEKALPQNCKIVPSPIPHRKRDTHPGGRSIVFFRRISACRRCQAPLPDRRARRCNHVNSRYRHRLAPSPDQRSKNLYCNFDYMKHDIHATRPAAEHGARLRAVPNTAHAAVPSRDGLRMGSSYPAAIHSGRLRAHIAASRGPDPMFRWHGGNRPHRKNFTHVRRRRRAGSESGKDIRNCHAPNP